MASEAKILIPSNIDYFLLEIPYAPRFIRELKYRVAAKDRVWDGEEYRWKIANSQRAEVERIAKLFFADVSTTLI